MRVIDKVLHVYINIVQFVEAQLMNAINEQLMRAVKRTFSYNVGKFQTKLSLLLQNYF